MQYSEYPPSPRTARFVHCFWILHGYGHARPEAILPDGRPELVFHFGAPFVRHLVGGRVDRQGDALLAGQMLEPVVLSHQGCAGVVGIRLRSAAARALLRLPLLELTGHIVDLGDVVPGARDLIGRLGAAPSDSARVTLLDDWLARLSPDCPRPQVEAAVASIHRGGGRADIGATAHAAGVSIRQLERWFRDDVGIAPKEFARIVRLQIALRHVRAGRALADTALACGYYDQAHMAGDFRRLAAISPRAWREGAGELSTLFAGC